MEGKKKIQQNQYGSLKKTRNPDGRNFLTSSQLTERYSLPVKVKETLTVQEIIHTQAGEIVLDMGQNMVGFVEFDSTFQLEQKLFWISGSAAARQFL